MARFLQILLQTATIVKLVACLSEFKTPNAHSMSDLVAQEQRLALHIITSKPESDMMDTRRPDSESFRPKKSEHVLRSDPLNSRPESVSHQVAPKRIVINLSHSETADKTAEANPTSVNIGIPLASKQPAAGQNRSIRANSPSVKRLEFSSNRNSEIQPSKGEAPRPQRQTGSFHESIVNSVRKQGGIPAIVVEDENEIEEDETLPRGKFMLGAEMIDRLATTSRDSSGSVKVVPESRPSEPYVIHTSRQNSEHLSSQNERTPNRQRQIIDSMNPSRNEDDGIKIRRRVASRAVSSHPKLEERDDLSRGDARKRFRPNEASEQLVSLPNQRHVDWQDAVSRASKSHHNGNNNGNSDLDVVKVSCSSDEFDRCPSNEQTNLAGSQQLMVFEKNNADHRSNQKNPQHNKQKRNDGSGNLRQVAPISRPSSDINLKSERHSEFLSSVNNNFKAHKENKPRLDHANLISANGMRVLIAVDETPNTTRKPERKRVDSVVTHHQKSASEKQVSSKGSQTSGLLSDKIAGLLDRLKLYTTREQLMKVANELQQYPDQKEAEDLSNANEPLETRQNNADSLIVERRPLETFSQAARHEPRIVISGRTEIAPPQRNIRNNVPAPILTEEFVDSLATSASQRGQYHDSEGKSGKGTGSTYSSEPRQLTPKLKFLDSKRDLQSRIKPDEAVTGTDGFTSYGAFEETPNDELANQDSDTNDPTSEDSQSDDANREPQEEADVQNEYTNNGDLLKTMEASESAYNMLGNGEDDDARSPSGKTSGFDHTPITGISDSGTSENDAALESTGGNDREDEEIKILEQIIDELVAAERNQKQAQQRSRDN